MSGCLSSPCLRRPRPPRGDRRLPSDDDEGSRTQVGHLRSDYVPLRYYAVGHATTFNNIKYLPQTQGSAATVGDSKR